MLREISAQPEDHWIDDSYGFCKFCREYIHQGLAHKPDCLWLRRMYFTYLRWMVPLFGRLFCGDAEAYGYILESLENYPAQAGVEAEMRALSCRQVQTRLLLGGVMTINYGEKA